MIGFICLASPLLTATVTATFAHAAPVIPRLGVPAYDWRNEALHGVVQGRATVFPQAIGLAATRYVDLMKGVAEAISALLGLEPALGIEPRTC